MKSRNWTRQELILAFNLYCKIPFGTFHNRNPKVIELATIIDRTPNAVALKLCNFASFDPHHKDRGVKGMQNASKLDKKIWDEFTNNWEELIFESEKLLAKFQNREIEKNIFNEHDEAVSQIGREQIREVKVRINQNFFRQIILGNYFHRCAICGMNIPELLIASHVIPWSLNHKERLNPRNGICFCSLHDKAFDRGFIGIRTNYQVVISRELDHIRQESYFLSYFGNYENRSISLPDKFLPKPEFLRFHLQEIFKNDCNLL